MMNSYPDSDRPDRQPDPAGPAPTDPQPVDPGPQPVDEPLPMDTPDSD